MLADDTDLLLRDAQQLVPTVSCGKQSSTKTSGVCVRGGQSFIPASGSCHTSSTKGGRGALIHHAQTYLQADNSAKR